MYKNVISLVILVFCAFTLSCLKNQQSSSKESFSPKKHIETLDRTDSYLVLTNTTWDPASSKFQLIDISNVNEIKCHPIQNSISKDSENEEELAFVGIVKGFICLQKWVEDYDYYTDGYKPSYTLMLYDVKQFEIDKPLYSKEFIGYPGTAFYTYGNNILIGSKNEIRLATIENNEIQIKVLYEFEILGKLKTVDVFVPFKNYILAIDDVIHPYFGFILSFEPGKTPEYIRTVKLPLSINMHYEGAVSDGENVYTLSGSYCEFGSSQHVFSLKYDENKFNVNYVYTGSVGHGMGKKEKHTGHFYPNLCDINLFQERILVAGMGGIIELNKNPDTSKKSPDGRRNFIVDFNNPGSRLNNKLDANFATDKIKLHEFDGFITSIAVVGDNLYALSLIYKNKPDPLDYRYDIDEIQKAELLVLKYDAKTQKFYKTNSIEVDKHLTNIRTNKN